MIKMNYLKSDREKMDQLTIYGFGGSYVVVKTSEKGRTHPVENE